MSYGVVKSYGLAQGYDVAYKFMIRYARKLELKSNKIWNSRIVNSIIILQKA